MANWQRDNRSERPSPPSVPVWAPRPWGDATGRRISPEERQALRAPRTGREQAESARANGSRPEPKRPVPKMPKPQRETQVRSPGITVAGTLLIVALTVLAFAGGRLFGRVEEPTPAFQA